MLIREVISTDASSYLALRIQAEREFPQFVGFNSERELAAGPDNIEALISSYPTEATHVFGAFDGARLIGVTALSRRLSSKYKHKVFLWGMYVMPELRGRGIAQSLMQATIDWTTEHPEILSISLQVTVSNIRGQQFYKHYGFSIFETEQRSLFAAGQFHDVHYMELEVKHS